MTELYINPKGQPVTHSSYSSRQTFKHCPREFELTRIKGWSDKSKRAAPMFGTCVEAGVKFFEESHRRAGAAVEQFTKLWNDVKTIPEFAQLIFTDTEVDWDSLLRAGREMMMLYEIRASYLPVSTNPKALWSQVIRKKIFPGTEYDKLENKAIFDILSFPRWNHPLLPKIDEPTDSNFEYRSLIIDMKTSGVDINTELIKLDPQLAEYAWMARIPDIAFLWFVKKGHSLQKGSRVSLLADIPIWKAGFELNVLNKGGDEHVGQWYVGTHEALASFEQAVRGLRGKALDAMKATWLGERVITGTVALVPDSILTKQRIQFGAARLTTQDMDEIGRDVAQTTVEMLRANKDQYYPKLAGIRFPNEKCNYCSMRWICLDLPEQRDQSLTRKGEEWLDGEQDVTE